MIADIDVVIPVRNGGDLLRDAIDSVLAQEAVTIRVIVVDDGSTDGAVDRVAADERIVVVPNRGRGIPLALNTGIGAGAAPLVARQDADDLSCPGRLVAEAEFLEANPSVGLVATHFDVLVGDRVVTTMRPLLTDLLGKNPICAGSTVTRRSVLDAIGAYRAAFALASDYDCWLRCADVAGVEMLEIVGYQYRLNAGMATIRHGRRQAAFAELARASTRARRAGAPDPVDEADSFIAHQLDGATDDRAEAEVAAWWAHEFAALGSRTDALRCLRSAWPELTWRNRMAAAAKTLRRPRPQAEWA